MRLFSLCIFLLLSSKLMAFSSEEQARLKHAEEIAAIQKETQQSLKEGLKEVENFLNTLPSDEDKNDSFYGLSQSKKGSSLEASFESKRNNQFPIKEGPHCQKGCQREELNINEILKPEASHKTAVIVFISLSMPEESLKALSKEAEACGARMVIRGLVNNEFAQTSQKLQSLKISVEIDPPLFEEFKIEHVPSFVHCKLSIEGPQVQNHDRVLGNVTLLHALEQFKEKGELKGVDEYLAFFHKGAKV